MLLPPWSDFIEDFMLLTEDAMSPIQFRLWTAIGMVAGALERRVWVKATRSQTFPNLYTLLTAAPGVGKQVILLARDLMTATVETGTKLKAFRVSPDNMTKAALIDTLAKAKNTRLLPKGTITYHSLQIIAEEFQVLLPTYDTEYISTLNSVFNNPDLPFSEARRHGPVREISIDLPQINILAGVQPSYFVSTFPEEAWTTGFARRIIMIYAAETPFQELFQAESDPNELVKARLLLALSHFSSMWGQMEWEPAAISKLATWHREKAKGQPSSGPPTPEHSKLTHYNNSRSMFVMKLSMVSAAARTGGLLISEFDVLRAMTWLGAAEARMPDVFREMIGKSDTAVIDELHYFVTQAWARGKQKPVPGRLLINFLRQRVPSEKVEKILLTADRAGIVVRIAGTEDSWIPKPRHEHGVE